LYFKNIKQNLNQGSVFIDRDGVRFRHVLNYLRTGKLPSFDAAWRYEEVAEEADFFALEPLKALAESVRRVRAKPN
jgi:hypothetical protein